ncbi:peptidylprolyl isomerase [Limobrevibacterium gyesilva]|uniref:Parvulin-like PPIase n=1 Tax=Limobrevibacterium gyesilva TaxID=2991712 RepID=A0AA41YV00_9PROT|nr:peptidylprolyl isomerase [Limobrevibacterium gyesilva]MCW3475902.1 peptidylprolyl isomerase [Limobrevibacterium gyesilva]
MRPTAPVASAFAATFVAMAALSGAPARAQAPAPAPAAAPAPAPVPAAAAPAPAPADPVVAKVGDQEIHLSDISEAVRGLPEEYRSMPQNMLFPLLLDQAIDRKAVVALARKQGLDQDPAVQRQIVNAQEQALQNALIARDVGPMISEPAIRALYDKDVAGKAGEEEVHARHILVANEADAVKIIADLKKGGDFAAIAKARSTDPGAAQGGDLGFFKKGDMLPEFATAAFALKPGQISDKPVKTQYGWHVIKVEERRAAPAPSFEQSHDELRQKLIQEGVQKVLAEARAGVKVERFNPDGTPTRPTDAAEPPPAPAKP